MHRDRNIVKFNNCQFEAKYYGGPADGLCVPLMATHTSQVPIISCLELYNLIDSKTQLGHHYLKQRPADHTRVAVYMVDESVEHDHESDVICYNFVQMMNYSEYLDMYGENNA